MRRNPNPRPAPHLADAVSVTRFWSLVEAPDGDMCWPWQGDTDRAGYGVFFFQGKKYGAHELALSFATGEARLPNLETCHSCDRPECVNPAHLRFDTRRANVADMITRGRAARPGRLTDADIITIRERRAAGARQTDLARDFGVTDGQISMIVRGKRWPNVGGPIETERRYNRGK